MRKIIQKQGLIAGITLSTLCFITYQILPIQNNILPGTSTDAQEPKSTIIEPAPTIEAKIRLPSTSITTPQIDNTKVAFQTPKKFPNGPFAPSIENTEIDGSLKADANGNLIIDLETRDLFDYFMNTVADVPPEVAIAELEKLARTNLPESALNQAMALLADYLLYKETALDFTSQPLLPVDQQDAHYQLNMLEASFERLRDIRRETMSAEAVEAFFGLEEAYGEFTLASIKIQQNPDLSPDQVQLELQAQREQLPELIRNTENRMHEETQRSQEINSILLSDRQDSEIEPVLRDKGLGEAAIQEALAYRQQQQQFEQQYALYKKERDQVSSASLSEKDMMSQKERLLQKYFDTEQAKTQAKVKDLSS
jgi:lipase chaperone LimK